MSMLRHLAIASLVVPSLGLAAGCSSAPPGEDVESTADDSEALSRSTAVSRADEWVHAKLHYCQSPHGEYDPDSSCWAHEGASHRCDRESVAAWNAYRSDCSGLVSWAWGLAAPGRTTYGFAPFDTAVTHAIPAESLEPGDAVNNAEHVMLFKRWVTAGHEAVFIEEPGCSSGEPYAHEFTSSVSIGHDSIYVSYVGMTFTAIRFAHISGGGAPSGGGGGSSNAKSCFSDTLGRTVADNTCVESRSDGHWYQCDRGSWVDRWTDADACSATYPLGGGGKGCYSDTLQREEPDDACVQSELDRRWYQCANGNWVNRWTDPSACNGVHPL